MDYEVITATTLGVLLSDGAGGKAWTARRFLTGSTFESGSIVSFKEPFERYEGELEWV
jgi:hypothetical protein